MKSWLEKNAIEMYSIHNERKSVVTERLIRTLKNRIYKYMTSISKNVYIEKLDDIVNKYNNIYHRTIIEQGRSVFQNSMGGLAAFKEELLAPREALIKAGCVRCREGV